MQNKFRYLMAIVLATAVGAFITSAVAVPAKASTWDKLTYVTVHEKIIAGDRVLEPGTYVWKLLDSNSNRHIVEIYDKDQRHLEETILAIPNYRLQPTGDTRFAFWETPPGVPKAVRAWFYPGDNFGQEFKYPKKLVAQFASTVPVPIPTAYEEPEPAPAAQPSPEPVPVQPAPQPVQQPAPAAEPSNTTPAIPQQSAPTLPHTASNIPLIGLIGLSSLGLAGVLSLRVKRG